MRAALVSVMVVVGLGVRWSPGQPQTPTVRRGIPMTERIEKTEEQWQNQLTAEQFRVTRRKGTERAFTGAYWNTKDDGVFQCVCCGQPLFDAEAKYDSRTG